jgi:putative heme-binding domain-containing protein
LPAADSFDPQAVVGLLELVIDEQTGNVDAARQCLGVLAAKIQSREVSAEQLAALRPRLDAMLGKTLDGRADGPLYFDAVVLAATWKNPQAVAAARKAFESVKEPENRRLAALSALVAAGEPKTLDTVAAVLADDKAGSTGFRSAVLASLGRSDESRIGEVVLGSYNKLNADLQAKAVELLTQRTAWSKGLLDAVGQGRVPASALNVNQVRKLLSSKDAELVQAVRAKWGHIRTDRDPRREAVVVEMRKLLAATPGDARRGQAVFAKVCGQCHKMYGEGAEVGPDITANGRASFEQLLSNVFDPSLVIGASYQAVAVRTTDGRVLTGLPVEDNDQRVVLKVQGGKQEVIAREEVDEQKVSELSLMPEDVEKQLKPQEIADLFALLCLDRPPGDPNAKRLPGAPR